MYFDSLQAALTMDGHGVYVWIAYLLTLVVIVVVLVAPARRRKRLLLALAAELKRTRGMPDNSVTGGR
jgi:heme exporter protein D